ncbi:uncharacterized protein VTP21DRAFT_3598 [Calcarisporiella thermophila]|uniref:uncharacterized protein n=1 Tax=Calcarisporiella thermophila TaxID=911321 RepID=UPI0037441582
MTSFENDTYLSQLHPPDLHGLQDLLMCESFFDEFTTAIRQDGAMGGDDGEINNQTTPAESSPDRNSSLPSEDPMLATAQIFLEFDPDNEKKEALSSSPQTLSESISSSPDNHLITLNSPEHATDTLHFPVSPVSPSAAPHTFSADNTFQQLMFDSLLSNLTLPSPPPQPLEMTSPSPHQQNETAIPGEGTGRATKRKKNDGRASGVNPADAKTKKRKQKSSPSNSAKSSSTSTVSKSNAKKQTGAKKRASLTDPNTGALDVPNPSLGISAQHEFAPAINLPTSTALSSAGQSSATEPMLKALLMLNNGIWPAPSADSNPTSLPLLPTPTNQAPPQPNKIAIPRIRKPIAPPQPHPSFTPLMKQQKKVAHNAIERRYRNNINDRITDLKNAVPALCNLRSKDSVEEIDGVVAATKLNKATILRKATEYIHYLRKSNGELREEVDMLRGALRTLPGGKELLEKCLAEMEMKRQANIAASAAAGEMGSTDDDIGSDEDILSDRESVSPSPSSISPSTSEKSESGSSSKLLLAAFLSVTLFYSPSMIGEKGGIGSEHPHHHDEKAIGGGSYLSGGSGMDVTWGWWLARACFFLVCLLYLSRYGSSSSSTRRHRRRTEEHHAHGTKSQGKRAPKIAGLPPRQVYSTLMDSLQIPHSTSQQSWRLVLGIFLEGSRFLLRRCFSVDFAPWEKEPNEAVAAGRWLRISEAELCGGNPNVTRLSVLYSALRTLNLAELVSSDRDQISSSLARVYATVAMQIEIAVPVANLARSLAQYFWQSAVNTLPKQAMLEADEGNLGLKWFKGIISEETMRDEQEAAHEGTNESRNECGKKGSEGLVGSIMWEEALYTFKHTSGLISTLEEPLLTHDDDDEAKLPPWNRPNSSTIPLALLANLHALHKLRGVYMRLLSTIGSTPKIVGSDEADMSEQHLVDEENMLSSIMHTTDPFSTAYWYALVAAAVEAYHFGHLEMGESLILRLKEIEPRHHPHCSQQGGAEKHNPHESIAGLECAHSDMTKQIIAFTFVGIALLRRGKPQEALRVLAKSRTVAEQRRNIEVQLLVLTGEIEDEISLLQDRPVGGEIDAAREEEEDLFNQDADYGEESVDDIFAPRKSKSSTMDERKEACREKTCSPLRELEREVETIADFLVGMWGFEAWIDLSRAMPISPSVASPSATTGSSEGPTLPPTPPSISQPEFTSILASYLLYLRRLISHPPLVSHSTVGEMLERLCRVNRIIREAGGDGADSGCECCEEDSVVVEPGRPHESEQKLRNVERAWRVLKGVC